MCLQEQGYRRRFPSGLHHYTSICQSLHRIQLFTIINLPLSIDAFSLSSISTLCVSLSSATVCLVNLGDNSWIICMPGVAMVIHHGLQALSNAFLGDYDAHSYRILATDSQGQQDKTPQYTKAAYPCPSGPQYTDKDKIQTEGKKKSNLPIFVCRRRTTICIFTS